MNKLAAGSEHKLAEGKAEEMEDSSVVAVGELGLLAKAVRKLAEVAQMAVEAAEKVVASILGSQVVADSQVGHIVEHILAELVSKAAELLLEDIQPGGMVAHNQ
jgi:pyridoxal biosynthesis lyase PdxS